MSIIDRIEVLEDGASAIYGSDAIAGVVNIITRKNFEGVEVNGYRGEYDLGGANTDAQPHASAAAAKNSTACSWPATSSRKRSARATGSSRHSRSPTRDSRPVARARRRVATASAIRRGPRAKSVPARRRDTFYNLTLNDGTTTPVWNPANPSAGTYHNFR